MRKWEIHRVSGGTLVISENGIEVAVLESFCDDEGNELNNIEANARLIAAAPGMELNLIKSRAKMRQAVALIKHLEAYTGGTSSSEDFAVMHLIEALNGINAVLEKVGIPAGTNAALAKARGQQ